MAEENVRSTHRLIYLLLVIALAGAVVGWFAYEAGVWLGAH
jgi:uncharacterized membrane protein